MVAQRLKKILENFLRQFFFISMIRLTWESKNLIEKKHPRSAGRKKFLSLGTQTQPMDPLTKVGFRQRNKIFYFC